MWLKMGPVSDDAYSSEKKKNVWQTRRLTLLFLFIGLLVQIACRCERGTQNSVWPLSGGHSALGSQFCHLQNGDKNSFLTVPWLATQGDPVCGSPVRRLEHHCTREY